MTAEDIFNPKYRIVLSATSSEEQIAQITTFLRRVFNDPLIISEGRFITLEDPNPNDLQALEILLPIERIDLVTNNTFEELARSEGMPDFHISIGTVIAPTQTSPESMITAYENDTSGTLLYWLEQLQTVYPRQAQAV